MEGLEQLDRHLSGLYGLGLELSPRSAEPGVAYLIAHAGRELGLGVVRLLSGVAPAFAGAELKRIAKKEKYRAVIAKMLGVPPNHASVTVWFQTQETLVGGAHFRLPPPAPEAVRDAFQQLSGLLFGRVAPYFSTHAELEALLTVPEPTPYQLKRVRELLLRPAQRHHFFGKLEHAAWLQALADAGYFTAPDLAISPDGTASTRPWPEGGFLVRVASADPEYVAQLLLAIPCGNQNPIVWDTVVRAALVLPVAQARRLVRPLVRAMRNSPAPHLLAYRFIDLTRALAKAKEPRAFELAECTLWLTNGPPQSEMVEVQPPTDAKSDDERPEETSASLYAAHPNRLHRDSGDTEWMLARLDAYGLSQFIQKALPSLEALDAGRLLDILAVKLERAVQLGRLPAHEENDVPSAKVEEVTVVAAAGDAAASPRANPRDESEDWADDLDHVNEGGDVRAQLAVALAGVASRTAARDTAGAQFVDKTLARQNMDVFTRIRLVALTAGGEFAPQSSLDAFVADHMAIDPPFRAREVAAFLREQFARASLRAQRQFLTSLERGPDPEFVERIVAFRQSRALDRGAANELIEASAEASGGKEAQAHDAESRDVIVEWQRTRLRWFHNRIPEMLAPLATALSVTPHVPSAQEQALDEVGSWSSEVHGVGYRSPLSTSEIATMSPETLVDYLSTWQPDIGVSYFEGPSPAGLEQALTSFVKEQPEKAQALARLLPKAAIAPGFYAAVLAGFEELAEAGRSLPWRTLVTLVEFVFSDAGCAITISTEIGVNAFPFRDAVRRAVGVLRAALAKDIVPENAEADLWRLADMIICSPITWSEPRSSALAIDSGSEQSEETLGDLEFAALNSLTGNAVRMLMDAALWDYRRHKRLEGATGANAAARAQRPLHDELRNASRTVPRLVPLLDSILEKSGRPGRLALTMLGALIPQLSVVARHWVLDHADLLFDGGATEPVEHPTWGTYLARGRFYDIVFRDLRAWYARAADAAPDPTPGSEQSNWSVSRNLAEHTIVAIVRGAAAIGDDDHLVEQVFSRTRVEDRVHAYWSIFRGWSDAKTPVPEEFVLRLVAFWDWRASILEGQAESEERGDEADGLGWFLVTPYIPPTEAIRLGLRTLRIASDDRRTGGSAWERLGELTQHDAVGTFELVELLARRALASDFPYLPFPQVAPPLRAALNAGNAETRMRARRLIHDMGERGLLEFGALLSQLGSESETP